MKKLILSLALALGFGATALAIRPVHKLFAMTNADGTTVQLYKHGHDRLAFYSTEDGRVVVRGADGQLVYAQAEGGRLVATTVRVHDVAERTAEEQAYRALTVGEVPRAVQEECTRGPRRIHTASTTDGMGKYGKRSAGSVPSIGEITIPVIMVEFADRHFLSTTTPDYMTRFYNEENFNGAGRTPVVMQGSVRDYFLEQSRGMFSPHFDVVARVTLTNGYATYGKNNAGGGDQTEAVVQMVSEAVAGAKAQGVDFSRYEDGTGRIPLVSILYAGVGEATSGDEDAIWPHQWDLPTAYATMSGYKFRSYFVGNELYYSKNLMGMGTFVHEFGHGLGLPDFYDPTYSYDKNDAFGMWSVMDGGCYNDESYNPVCYTAYERSFMGWLNIPMLGNAQSVTLAHPSDTTGNYAVGIPNPKLPTEHFILENRQNVRWTPTGAGTGMMVTRIKYSEQAWDYNTVNDAENKKRACVITANGAKIDGAALSAHLFGNGVADRLTLPLFAGTELATPLYQIIKHSGGTISLSYKSRNLYVETADNGDRYALVGSIDELQPNDTILIVNRDEAMTLSTQTASGQRPATTIKLIDGAACGNDDVLALRCLRTADGSQWGFVFRSGTKNYYLAAGGNGSLTTATKASATSLATIDIQDGFASITFGGTQAATTVTYSPDNTSFRLATSDDASALSIYRKVDDITPVTALKAQGSKATAVYTLSGQYAGTSLNGLPRGIYIVNGRKVVK